MSELFNTLYDEIFLNSSCNALSDETINDITQAYISSNVCIKYKKTFLKLKEEYYRIKSLGNYKTKQASLYGGKSRREIIMFEIARILNTNKNNYDVVSQIDNIYSMLDSCGSVISDDIYKKIINTIITIELSLGMNVGLFKELCTLFEEEVKRIRLGDLPDTTYKFRK